AADRGAHGEGHEGRPRKVSRRRRLGLPRQAREHRAAARDLAALAAPLSRSAVRASGTPRARSHERSLARPARRGSAAQAGSPNTMSRRSILKITSGWAVTPTKRTAPPAARTRL